MGSPTKQVASHASLIQYASNDSPPAEKPARAFIIEGDGATNTPQACTINLTDNTSVVATLAPGIIHHIAVVSVTGGNAGTVTYLW